MSCSKSDLLCFVIKYLLEARTKTMHEEKHLYNMIDHDMHEQFSMYTYWSMVCAQFSTCIQKINLVDIYCSHCLGATAIGFMIDIE